MNKLLGMLGIGAIQAAQDNAEKKLVELQEIIDKISARSFLLDIQRDGRMLKFIFARMDGEIYVIETMGQWSDDVPAWKKALIGT